MSFLLVITAPIAIIIALLRPWVLIRFGVMRSERIGHFAADTEAYAQERQRQSSRKVIDILGCDEPVCNQQLKTMWQRTFPIMLDRWVSIVRGLGFSCSFWARTSEHSVNLSDRSPDYRFFPDSKSTLYFTEEESRRGKKLLAELGLNSDADWVCIHNRDSAYLEKQFNEKFSYHAYRDYDIESMLAAAEALTERGYFVLRVGSVVEKPLNSANPRIIDYSSSALRSDFLDIFLLAHTKFFLGNDSGIWCVPLIFRRPIALTNFSLLSNFYEKDYDPLLIIPKRVRDPKLGRFLTLRETLKAGFGDAGATEIFAAAGVELVNNSSVEILDLAVELDERTNGTWKPHPVDAELQRRFWKIFTAHANGREIPNRRARIGAAFLRRHTDYLS